MKISEVLRPLLYNFKKSGQDFLRNILFHFSFRDNKFAYNICQVKVMKCIFPAIVFIAVE